MKQARKKLWVPLLALVLVSMLLAGCTATSQEVRNLDKAALTAAQDLSKAYIKNEFGNQYLFDSESSQLGTAEHVSENLWRVSGVLGLKEAETEQTHTMPYTVELESIDYIGMVTATFRLVNTPNYGDIQ